MLRIDRDDGVAPEGAVGFLVVGEGVVAGDASPQSGAPHRRSMGGTPRANAISRAAACLVLTKSSSAGVSDSGFQSRPPSRRRGRPAYSVNGHASHERTLEAFLEFVLQALELFRAEAAL